MNNKRWDSLWVNGLVVTMAPDGLPIEQGALAVKDGMIAWVGKMQALPGSPAELADEVFDVSGQCITPGLIDCHTHIVYGGNRSHEFQMRTEGATYEEIALAGGGIRSTVAATRVLSEEDLFQQSIKRVKALIQEGVTTLEIKSGYGLDCENELKMLRVAKRIGETLPVTVVKTFLGAHTVPLAYQGRADDYINFVCDEVMPRVAELHLAESVDVFCETIGFNLSQTERVFKAAKIHGLSVKCHAEQLSHSGAAALAARYQALSVDHLECLTEDSIKIVSKTNTVAVLLPGAFYFLRETKKPPIALLRQYNIPMAIATDCNPGTSPMTSLLLAMNMASTLFGLSTQEILMGVTINAARALGLESQVGTLTPGKAADFVVWDVKNPAEIIYAAGFNPCVQIVKSGNS